MIKVAAKPKEVMLNNNSLIVSKTDLTGKITYVNREFMRVSDFAEHQALEQNHNLIRHPDMPRGVFYGLWTTLQNGEEFFGFVKNITAHGDHYWVFANITPDLLNGKAIGYFSVRRQASAAMVALINPIYEEMRRIEQNTKKEIAPSASWKAMQERVLSEYHLSYDEFVVKMYEQNI